MHSTRKSFRHAIIAGLILFILTTISLVYHYNLLQHEFVKSNARMVLTKQKDKPHPCDLIHIGIVCVTHESKLRMYTMLKSLLNNRKSSPLALYIVTNPNLQPSLSKLFGTWALPQVKVNFYNLKDIDPRGEFAGTPNMLRLMLPKLIKFEKLSKIILLSTDIAFYSDIFELWNKFQYFHEDQFLGIPTAKHMDIFDRGYADVVLYHLDNLRKQGWNNIWKKIKDRQVLEYNENAQIQLIFNYFTSSKLAYSLDCSWNAMSRPESKCMLEYKVVHHDNVGERPGLFIEQMKEFDGNKVRKQTDKCYAPPTKEKLKRPITEKCSLFPESRIQQKRTLLYLYEYRYKPSASDVTLVTQLSLDKFDLVEEFAIRWKGPMSITLYLTDKEYIKCLKLIKTSDVLKERFNIGYHVVFKYGKFYHINYLRNVALNEVKTAYVFSNDIDLLPMENLYSVLKKYLADIRNMTKKALVVPAFETKKLWDQVPSTMKELLELLQQKKIFIVQKDTRPEGHAPTDYEKWKKAKSLYKVTWKNKYEPYVVVKSNVVRYDERFFSYGWDKISHIMELEAQGYQFYVLPNTYIVHKFHTKSDDKITFLSSKKYKICLKSLKEKSAKDLKDKYGRTFLID